MSNAVEFLISVEQRLKGDDAVTELQKQETAIKDGIAAYKQLETSTAKSTSALEKVAAKIATIRTGMEGAMKAGDGDAFWKAAGALQKLEAEERKLKTSIDASTKAMAAQKAGLQSGVSKLEGMRASSAKTGVATALAGSKIFELKDALGKMGGPVGNVGARLFDLGDGLKKFAGAGGGIGLAVAASVIAIAVIVALGAAFVGLGVAALKTGVMMSNAARQQRLSLEAMLESKSAAAEMHAEFRSLQKTTGATTDRLTDITKSLKEAKVTGGDMKTALRAIAMQEAAIGQDGTTDLITKLKSGQVAADDLAKTIEEKYGDNVRSKMIGVDQSVERLKGNFGALFSGLNLESALEAFSRFVDLFDESSSMGRTMKGLFETIFQPLLDSAANVFPYVRLFIDQFINICLKVAVALKPAIDKMGEMMGMEPKDTMAVVLTAAKVAAVAFVVVLLVIAAIAFVLWLAFKNGVEACVTAWDVLMATIDAAPELFDDIRVAISKVGTWFLNLWNNAKAVWNGIKEGITSAFNKLKEIDLGEIAKSILDGFIKGIKDGTKRVTDQVTKMGSAIKDAMAESQESHSPSALFERFAKWATQGYVIGIERGTPEIEHAVSHMLSGNDNGPRSGRSGGVVIERIELHVHGVEDAAEIMPSFRAQATDLFRELALELGGAPREEAA